MSVANGDVKDNYASFNSERTNDRLQAQAMFRNTIICTMKIHGPWSTPFSGSSFFFQPSLAGQAIYEYVSFSFLNELKSSLGSALLILFEAFWASMVATGGSSGTTPELQKHRVCVCLPWWNSCTNILCDMAIFV